MEKIKMISKINSAKVNLKANWFARQFNRKDTILLLDEVLEKLTQDPSWTKAKPLGQISKSDHLPIKNLIYKQ